MSNIEINSSSHLLIRDQITNKVMITQNGCLLLWDKVGKYLFVHVLLNLSKYAS